ncbi:uncharacterized protein [Dysidea avara]|uniref:uncharacterized protein n=1 Tax=Dysidea avara TaxID=196820 RepID=UPI003323D6B2
MWSSRWPVVWFLLSGLLVIWDCCFVLLRPHSLPKGRFHHFFVPYVLYYEVDKAYADIENEFVWGQSWLNVVEVCLQFLTIYLIFARSSKAVLVGFLVSVLTFWKTVLYMIQYTEICNGGDRLSHVDIGNAILFFVIPNGFWLVFPFILIIYYGRKLSTALDYSCQMKKD